MLVGGRWERSAQAEELDTEADERMTTKEAEGHQICRGGMAARLGEERNNGGARRNETAGVARAVDGEVQFTVGYTVPRPAPLAPPCPMPCHSVPHAPRSSMLPAFLPHAPPVFAPPQIHLSAMMMQIGDPGSHVYQEMPDLLIT